MKNESPQSDGLPGILADAELFDPARVIAAWLERRTPSADVDLEELERAQRDYQDVLTMLAETLPFREWLQWRPRHLKPRYYREWIKSLQGMAQELEAEFGVDLLAVGPPMFTQREMPN